MDINKKHCAVVGAGIMGLMSAYSLLQAGHKVSLFDPSGLPPSGNASALAGGMLAPYSEIDLMTPDFVQAGLDSINIWKHITNDLGIHGAFTQHGSLLVAHNEDHYMLERFATHLLDHDCAQRLGRDDIERLEPSLPAAFRDGLLLPEEATVEPVVAMKAIAAFIERDAGFHFEQLVVAPHEIAGDYHSVIDCRGHGAAMDDDGLRGVKGEIAIVENTEIEFHHTIRMMHPRYPLYIVPRRNGQFMIGATQIESSADTSVSVRSAMELLSAVYSLHPSFGEARILDLQAGIRPAYPDNLPRVTKDGNVIRCNGLFRHGYLLSPVIAKAVVSMVDNGLSNSLFVKEAA